MREGHVYIHSAKIPLTRAPVSVAYNGAMISCRGGAPAPSQNAYKENKLIKDILAALHKQEGYKVHY